MARRAKEQEKPENHERWLITYADMITLLMVFFIVLYASSVTDRAKFDSLATALQQAFNVDVLKGIDPAPTAPDPGSSGALAQLLARDLERLQQVIDPLRGAAPSVGGMETELNREGILISLYGNLLFDSGKATLKDEALGVLTQLSRTLAPLPNTVRVEGHTDSIPIQSAMYPSNWELSAARATAVVRYFAVAGINPQRMQATGYGETRPRNPNDTREQRARNRRVDIQLSYPEAQRLTSADLRQIQGAVPGGSNVP
ncbi:MAG: OmpA family protein [Chloroflexi bacterium]|nr:OmpA family protein [Chloroflexota bacterium]